MLPRRPSDWQSPAVPTCAMYATLRIPRNNIIIIRNLLIIVTIFTSVQSVCTLFTNPPPNIQSDVTLAMLAKLY